jgi:hypothetical protein
MLSDLESGVAAFHNALRDELPVLELEQAPAQGSLKQVNQELRAKARVSAAS